MSAVFLFLFRGGIATANVGQPLLTLADPLCQQQTLILGGIEQQGELKVIESFHDV